MTVPSADQPSYQEEAGAGTCQVAGHKKAQVSNRFCSQLSAALPPLLYPFGFLRMQEFKLAR